MLLARQNTFLLFVFCHGRFRLPNNIEGGGGVILFNNNSGWSTEAVSSKGVHVGKCIGKF